MDCSCAPMFQFFPVASDGATTERQIQYRVFWSISYQFEEGQRRQLCIDLDTLLLFVKVPDLLCNALNTLQFRRLVAPQDSLICGGNIPKRRNSAAQLCEILRILTIYIVINFTHVQQHMRMTISCRYALSFVGRCFCFQFCLLFVRLGVRSTVRSRDAQFEQALRCCLLPDFDEVYSVFHNGLLFQTH